MTQNPDDMTSDPAMAQTAKKEIDREIEQAIADLTQAANPDPTQSTARPDPATVVAAMLTLERQARRDRPPLTPADLQGTWQLRFITGTQAARRQTGTMLGKGRYLPGWLRIAIAYHPQAASPQAASPEAASPSVASPQAQGQVINQVGLGPLSLTVSGPWEIIAGKRISSSDFVQWAVEWGNWQLGRGQMRKAVDFATAADRFYASPLKDRAFFNFFWTSKQAIAARGRGGGLALWQFVDEGTHPS
jgi:hypothetical protein